VGKGKGKKKKDGERVRKKVSRKLREGGRKGRRGRRRRRAWGREREGKRKIA